MKHQLANGKVTLRPVEPHDIDLLYLWENNLEIWNVSNTKTPFSRFILAEYLRNSAKDIYETKQLRLIIETTEGEPVGAIDLFDFDPFNMRAGIGILIHKTENRACGYASDALRVMFYYALNVLALKQLYANIAASNKASFHLFQKAGFTVAGTKIDWLKTANGWENEYLLQKML